jgi:4-amino-4-deoxy-L-arabinose transferase-like glycosyltransferase
VAQSFDKRPVLRLTLAALLLVSAAFLVFRASPADLEGDQQRYAILGLNLADHGVFSSASYAPEATPAPSLAWSGPLIAGEVALAALLDPATKDQLVCIATGKQGCALRLPALRLLHLCEILVFLACLWTIGHSILADEALAWLTAALGLAFREVIEFSNLVMSEPLYLMAYGLFAAVLVMALVERKGPAWWILTGLLLGLVVLAKTSAAVLVPIAAALLIIDGARRRALAPSVFAALCLLLASSVVVAAWMARSEALFHTLSLTDPVYLEGTLSHRLAFDRMSWMQWVGGWLYYLPDFGDNAAAALFGEATVKPLGFGPDGFYHYGYYVLHPQAHAFTAPALATGYLVKTYMLGEPAKFAAVTALLMWRGIFVGGYLGIAGLIALVIALWRMPARQRDPVALLATLGFALALANGALSVSITRYNLALIPVYTVSLAWLLGQIWSLLILRRTSVRDASSREA